MAVFVVLALAVLALAVGAVVVAVLQVRDAAVRGRAAVETTQQRLRPLTEELQAELAATSTETDAVGRRVSELTAARHARRRRRRTGGSG